MQSLKEKNTEIYLKKLKIGLFFSLLYVLLSELFMFFFVKNISIDFSQEIYFIQERWTPDFNYFLRHILKPTIINFSSYFIYYFLFNKVSLKNKKKLTSIMFMLFALTYSFFHWGFIYLSVLFLVPIFSVCPLGKKINYHVCGVSIVLSVLYCLYQNCLIYSFYNFLILSMNIAVILCSFFISSGISKLFENNIADLEKYKIKTESLINSLSFDSLTGAFSKFYLQKTIDENRDFNSICFIDLNNFKYINDTYGHQRGDEILIKVVSLLRLQGLDVYRFGGDEFIILSELSKDELVERVDLVYKILEKKEISFSFGCLEINPNTNLKECIEKSDKIMYDFKRSKK